MKEFAGKVAGITGAANGIGEAFALEAARRGMNLALIDIEGDRLQEVKKECEALGAPKVVTITVDVSEYEQVRMSVERIMAEFERIDVFYSNAGGGRAAALDTPPHQGWGVASVNFLVGACVIVAGVSPLAKAGPPMPISCSPSPSAVCSPACASSRPTPRPSMRR